MTDVPDDIEAALADLEKTQKHGHRVLLRTLLVSFGALMLLAGINTAFVLRGGGAWVFRDLTMIGGLTALGAVGYLHAATLRRFVVQRDAEIIERFREQSKMAASLESVKPLLTAIEEAHARGIGLLIPPGSLPPAPPPSTVH